MRELEKYRDLLAASEMLKGAEGDGLWDMLALLNAHVAEYGKGETVYRVGDPVREASIVLEGSVMMEANDFEGEKTNMNMIQKGQEFGACLLLGGISWSPMRIYAATRCKLLMLDVLSAAKDEGHTRERLLLTRNLLTHISGRCMDLYFKVQIYGKKRIRSRIRTYILSLEERDGEVRLPVNRTALAACLGVDRTALARELSRMQEEGIIAVNKRCIRLLDRGFFYPDDDNETTS